MLGMAAACDAGQGWSGRAGTEERELAAAHTPMPHPAPRRTLQEFRRLQSMVGAARDRLDLLGGAAASQHAGLQSQGNAGLLLRERGMLASTNAALDEVMGTAQVRCFSLPCPALLPLLVAWQRAGGGAATDSGLGRRGCLPARPRRALPSSVGQHAPGEGPPAPASSRTPRATPRPRRARAAVARAGCEQRAGPAARHV